VIILFVGGDILDEVFTPKEVAAKLKVSERTINEWLRNGKLKASKLGRQWRITEQQLNEFLKDHEQK
jgi:putative molybdopterin biosynthesis protein